MKVRQDGLLVLGMLLLSLTGWGAALVTGCADDDDGAADADADVDGDGDGDSDSDSDSDTDTDSDTDGDGDGDSDSDPECANDTVPHPDSGLVWMRCSVGASWEWDGEECVCAGGLVATFTHDEIEEECPSGFRPPTAEELMDVLGGCDPWSGIASSGSGQCDGCGTSTTCGAMFPGEARFFWSGTEFSGDASQAFSVGFNFGDVDAQDKTNTYYLRCVEE